MAQELAFTYNGTITATTDLYVIDMGDGFPVADPLQYNTGPSAELSGGHFFNVGPTVSGTTPTVTPEIQHSDDSIFWEILCYAKNGTPSHTVSTTANLWLAPVTRKRFIKLTAVVTGTSTPTFTVSAGYDPMWSG